MPDLLRVAVDRYPDRVAFTYYGRHLTYREVDRLSSKFANRLIEHGVKPGDRVLIVLANMPQYPIVHLGTLKAGGVVAALSPLLVERELDDLAVDSGARLVVPPARVWDRLAPLVVPRARARFAWAGASRAGPWGWAAWRARGTPGGRLLSRSGPGGREFPGSKSAAPLSLWPRGGTPGGSDRGSPPARIPS